MKKNKKKIAAIIQARMGSKRFPGKVMKKICNKPIIQLQIERLRKSKYLDEIILSTSTSSKDKILKNFCEKKMGIKVFAGSENDVLDRVSKTVKKFNVDIHVECFGDSPLVDPKLIDQFLKKFKKIKTDCLTNTLKTTYPPGQEIFISKGKKLNELDRMIKKNDILREHVSFNFTRFQDKFSIFNIHSPKKYNFPEIYMEIDRPVDLKFLKKIYNYFDKKKKIYFSLDEILKFLKKNSELPKINNKVFRKWKLLR